MDSVDYLDTLIAVAEDTSATRGTPPPVDPANPSIAARTYQLLARHPYGLTSGDVIFRVYAERKAIPAEDWPRARAEFYARDQACLRSSELGRRYGWGIHADHQGRLALLGMETPGYQELVSGTRPGPSGAPVRVKHALRSRRAGRPARPG